MQLYFDKFDVVGYRIVSPFHLMSFLSFCLSVHPEKEKLNVLVIFSRGPWEKQIVNQVKEQFGRIDVNYVLEDELEIVQSRFLAILILTRPIIRRLLKSQLIVCSPSFACLKFSSLSFGMSLVSDPVIIDEGIGSYNFLRSVRAEMEEKYGPGMRRSLMYSLFKFVNKRFSLFGGSRYQLFEKREGELLKNEGVAESYRKTLEMLAYERPAIKLEDRIVLFLTQPFIEMGLCSAAEYKKVLFNVLSIAKFRGSNIVVKPHPAENPEIYLGLGLEVLEYQGAVEEIYAHHSQSIDEVWGFFSTALVTAKAIFDIPARRIISEMDEFLFAEENSDVVRLFEKYTSKLFLEKELSTISKHD